VSPLETFGTSDEATWQATDIEAADGLTHFKVRRRGDVFGRFASPLLGVHNVRNAVAAIAVGSYVGISPADLAEGLRTFQGIKRRLEVVGTADGVTVIDDFAHHPTAVHETLSALRSGYPDRRIWAVFEPRSASSCRRVFQADFARAFGAADEVIVAAVFRSSLRSRSDCRPSNSSTICRRVSSEPVTSPRWTISLAPS
jgi:UDP-N-acetylmuramate: L-alanyl-gamma-D-glutamyl-meso-diaminopimelate ligase